MATIPYTQLSVPTWLGQQGVTIVQWANVGNADTCTPLPLGAHADRSVQVTGTFDGASVKIDGTNDASLAYFPLTDPQGNAISISAFPAGYTAAGEAISEATQFIKPVVSGGTAPSLTITLYVRKVIK
jgi:hypothetical protein